ncbi:probable carboxylesterase 1 [Jatropha curcas]|nr:probable carboxylesterase 1 [Jatropha curcas]
MQMSSNTTKAIARDFFPFFKVHEDGHVERYVPIEKIPPSDDPHTGVRSKDVTISLKPNISARIFTPKMPNNPNVKLPVLVYFHGGAFALGSAFDPVYHKYLTCLVHEANVIAVSVEYRKVPENPVTTCYDDSWAALQWVASHANGYGSEPWLSDYGDFGRVFMAGDSAGANISYNVAVRLGSYGLDGVKLEGMILVHPYFKGTTHFDKMWLSVCPTNGGLEDPRLKPAVKDMASTVCERVLVFIAQKDLFRKAGISYYKELKKSGWKGKANMVVHEGAGHAFHLSNPNCEQALSLMKDFVSFINE